MNTNRITSISAMLISVIYLCLITRIAESPYSDPIGAKAFPLLCGFGMLFSGIVLFFYDAFITREKPFQPVYDSNQLLHLIKSPLLITTLVGCLYAILFDPLGYPLSTAVLVMLLMTYLQKKRWLANTVFSLSFSLGSYLLFVKILNLSFPLGILDL